MAASKALAELARQPVPDSVKKIYPERDLTFGKEYIIPTPFDPRLIEDVSMAVARAAMESGVAKKHIQDWDQYRKQLRDRLEKYSNRSKL